MLLEILILHYRNIVRKPIFDQTFTYSGEDLGSFTHQIRRNLNLGTDFARCESPYRRSDLSDDTYRKRCLETLAQRDWEGAAYHYEFRVNGLERRISRSLCSILFGQLWR